MVIYATREQNHGRSYTPLGALQVILVVPEVNSQARAGRCVAQFYSPQSSVWALIFMGAAGQSKEQTVSCGGNSDAPRGVDQEVDEGKVG